MARMYPAEVIPCCIDCDKANETKVCKKCNVVYCGHYASTTDVRYCANCISDFAIKETIMEKTVEHERPDGTISFSRKYQARHLMLTGTDWLFNARLISDMSDAEIEATIEYHRANVGLMLDERESRKKERYEKLSKIRVVNVKHESQAEREKREAKATGKGKRTKTKDVTVDSMVEMLQQLAKSGMTVEQLTSLLGGK